MVQNKANFKRTIEFTLKIRIDVPNIQGTVRFIIANQGRRIPGIDELPIVISRRFVTFSLVVFGAGLNLIGPVMTQNPGLPGLAVFSKDNDLSALGGILTFFGLE
jgi:hypothetical protein